MLTSLRSFMSWMGDVYAAGMMGCLEIYMQPAELHEVEGAMVCYMHTMSL